MAMSRSSSADSQRSRVMTMSATLKRAHCMADGQLTPPSSPDAVRRALPRSKLQISKFLRRPKIVKKDTALTSHRVESTVTRSVNDRMDPFPLLLPASPLDSENSSTLTVSPVPQPELRRMSTSYDLRSIAARHSVFKATPVSTPLLPSPIDQGTSEADQSYFRFHNPRALPPCEEDYTSYEDLHILSCYYDGSKPGSMDEIEKALEEDDCLSQGSLMSEDVDGDSDSTETEVPRTPPEQINCSTACSSEGNWLASDQSHEERLRRFKARCYQVVQHPMSDRRDKREVDDQIMLATVLVGPGKPKLVQIPRPSSGSSRRDSITTTQSTHPQTPDRNDTQISAFSPFDTSGDIAPYNTPAYQPDLVSPPSRPTYSSLTLVPAPLSLSSQPPFTPSSNSSTIFSASPPQFPTLSSPIHFRRSFSAGPASAPAHDRRSSVASPQTTYSLRQPHSLLYSHPPTPHPTPTPCPSTSSRSCHLLRLRCTLEAVTQSINSFPTNVLHLDSPWVLELRPHHVETSIYLQVLQRVFPQAEALALSALGAWVLLMWYLQRVLETAKLDSKGPAVLLTPEGRSKSIKQIQGRTEERFKQLAMKSNECLARIPTRAREMLGISSPDLVGVHETEAAARREESHKGYEQDAEEEEGEEATLMSRARTAMPSIRVVAQRLMEVSKWGTAGCICTGRAWDEDLWRSLTVLFEVAQRSDVTTLSESWM